MLRNFLGVKLENPLPAIFLNTEQKIALQN